MSAKLLLTVTLCVVEPHGSALLREAAAQGIGMDVKKRQPLQLPNGCWQGSLEPIPRQINSSTIPQLAD